MTPFFVRSYVPEEKLVGEMAGAVQQLVIEPDTLAWLQSMAIESDKNETVAREQALRQLKTERSNFASGTAKSRTR